MENRVIKPFAITATALGHPRKLHTPIVVVNMTKGNELIAARVNAMWDTGADISLMSKELAEKLEIDFTKPMSGVGMFGTGETVVGFAYIALMSNGQVVETYAAIIDSTSPTGEYSFIIGMDFIRKGTLAISSSKLETTLSFTIPSPEPIDFTRLKELADESKAHLPLSSERENIRPVYGDSVIGLLTRKDW